MPFKFFLTNGEPLPFRIGLPSKYNGPVLRGADVHFITHPGFSITVQQHQSRHMGIALTKITWKKPERIVYEADHMPALFVRTLFNRHISETIKAVGEVQLDSDHFYALAGSKWRSYITPGKPGDYYFLDLHWHIDKLNAAIPGIGPFSFTAGVPQKLLELPCSNSSSLQHIFHGLMKVDYSFNSQRLQYHELMNECLTNVRHAIADSMCIKNRVTETDWHFLQKAKMAIHEKLERRLSTPEISLKIGVNEYKLKKLFKKGTGYSIDEYRKYRLFSAAARTLAHSPGMLLKMMSYNTGYENEASMLRAFKNSLYCTPGEIKSGEWDLSGLDAIPASKWKQRD